MESSNISPGGLETLSICISGPEEGGNVSDQKFKNMLRQAKDSNFSSRIVHVPDLRLVFHNVISKVMPQMRDLIPQSSIDATTAEAVISPVPSGWYGTSSS